jgi:succinylarginine dihydrolase
MASWNQVSNPKAAALEGLAKMKRLHDLGVPQGVLPPLVRPVLSPLRRQGFTGSDAAVLRSASRQAPELLAACWSASAMWVANAATVTPSSDSEDGKVHVTAANLVSKFHRALEAQQTASLLRRVFRGDAFRHHPLLPRTPRFADEGAANHCRLCVDHGGPGVHLFVYGRDAVAAAPAPRQFPARQSRQASEAICRVHGLARGAAILSQQNPDAIDAGVFHNDVIATSHRDVFFYHEFAYVDTRRVVSLLSEAFAERTGRLLNLLEVSSQEIPLELAVRSYLFNSQIITTSDGRTMLIAPVECARTPTVRTYLDHLISRPNSPITAVEYVDVGQSMRGGGGPACLRLRVTLTPEQRHNLGGQVLLTERLYERLVSIVQGSYPESVAFGDLADPAFLIKCRLATARIHAALGLERASAPGLAVPDVS